MLGNQAVGTNDIERSKRFYTAVFQVLGGGEATESTDTDGSRRLIFRNAGFRFEVIEPFDRRPVTFGSRSYVGLFCESPGQVLQFYAVAVKHGGTPFQQPHGPQSDESGDLHCAYVLDPDENKLCAYHSSTVQRRLREHGAA